MLAADAAGYAPASFCHPFQPVSASRCTSYPPCVRWSPQAQHPTRRPSHGFSDASSLGSSPIDSSRDVSPSFCANKPSVMRSSWVSWKRSSASSSNRTNSIRHCSSEGSSSALTPPSLLAHADVSAFPSRSPRTVLRRRPRPTRHRAAVPVRCRICVAAAAGR